VTHQGAGKGLKRRCHGGTARTRVVFANDPKKKVSEVGGKFPSAEETTEQRGNDMAQEISANRKTPSDQLLEAIEA